MGERTSRVVRVRRGRIEPAASWLYVWVDVADGAIAYVGATGLDPELRTFLHLTSEDPQLGRVRADVLDVDARDFDVLAFALPAGISRASAKRALVAHLLEVGHLRGGESTEDSDDGAVRAMVEEVRHHVAGLEADRHLA